MTRLSVLVTSCMLAAAGCALDSWDGALPGDPPTAENEATAESELGAQLQCGRLPPCCPGFFERDGFCFMDIRTRSQDFHPLFYVVSVIYVPPGRASSVAYQNGTGVAHRVDTSSTYKDSLSYSVKIGPSSVGATFATSTVNGHSYQVKNSAVSLLSVTAADRSNDEIPPDDDIFVVAFGPKIIVSQTTIGTNTSTTVYAPDFDTALYIRVTTAQLKNPALMDPFTASLFVNFTPADYQSILSLNPRAIGQEIGDPGRYTYVRNMALQGPLPPLYDNRIAETQTYTRSAQNDNTSGRTREINVKVEADLFGVLKSSQQMTFSYTNTVTESNDTSRSATVTLSTTTRDCAANYAVYYDSFFNTLAFKSLGSAPACR